MQLFLKLSLFLHRHFLGLSTHFLRELSLSLLVTVTFGSLNGSHSVTLDTQMPSVYAHVGFVFDVYEHDIPSIKRANLISLPLLQQFFLLCTRNNNSQSSYFAISHFIPFLLLAPTIHNMKHGIMENIVTTPP